MNAKIKSVIVKNLTSQNKFDAIKEFIKKIPLFQEYPMKEELTQAVIQREKIMSTGLGHGVAIAHGKLPSIKNIYIGLGISRQGIEYDSNDGKPVHFLFLIVHHPDQQNSYLQVLAALANIINHTLVNGGFDVNNISFFFVTFPPPFRYTDMGNSMGFTDEFPSINLLFSLKPIYF